MATKPTIALARFADTGSADKTAPSSGLRDTGFVAGTPVSQSFVNELLFQFYSWHLYLDEGDLDGDHSIDGALTVGGQPLVFADFTYTADAGTDTLTKTAHGLETGDGAARTTTSGTLPGGLAAATDYFVIRTGANTFKLATSRANALAGVAIDITSAGSGTHTLIDQAGTTRVTDATVTRDLTVGGTATVTGGFATDVKAPDFLFTDPRTFHVCACSTGAPSSNFPALTVDHTNGGVAWNFTATTQRLAVPLGMLRVGDQILSFGARANTTSSLSLQIKLWFSDPGLASGTGNATQVGSTLTHSNTLGDQTHTLASPKTVAAGESYHVTAGGTVSASSVTLFDVFVTIDRPV